MTLEELEKEAREQAKRIEENQTLGVYDSDEDLEYDKGWNAGEVSGYKDGYIAGAEAREKRIAKLEKEAEELQQKYLEESYEKSKLVAQLTRAKETNEKLRYDFGEGYIQDEKEFWEKTSYLENKLTKAEVALRNVIDYLGQFCSDYPDCVIEAKKILKELGK